MMPNDATALMPNGNRWRPPEDSCNSSSDKFKFVTYIFKEDVDIDSSLHIFSVVDTGGLDAVVNKLTKCLITGCKQIKYWKVGILQTQATLEFFCYPEQKHIRPAI